MHSGTMNVWIQQYLRSSRSGKLPSPAPFLEIPMFLCSLVDRLESIVNIVDGFRNNSIGTQMQKWITMWKRNGQQYVLC